MDKGAKIRWSQLVVPSLQTHGILGVAVHIVGTAAYMALGIGSTVLVGLSLVHYFQGYCSILVPLPNNCFNQAPFSNWIMLLLFIGSTLEYIEKLILKRRKRELDDAKFSNV
jgi:hypothetical protein